MCSVYVKYRIKVINSALRIRTKLNLWESVGITELAKETKTVLRDWDCIVMHWVYHSYMIFIYENKQR